MAVFLTLVFGPFGLFYARPGYGLIAVAALLAVIVIPFGVFYLALHSASEDFIVISTVVVLNLWFAVAAVWIISMVVAFVATRKHS